MDYSNSSKNTSTKMIVSNAFVMLTVLLSMLLAVLLTVQPAMADETPPLSSPLPGTDTDPASCPNNAGECGADVGTAPGGNEPDDSIGNPINLMTGNKHQSEVDFDIPGAMLSLRRAYNSGDSDSNRGLGQGWSHSFTVTLLNAGDGNLQIAQSDGGRINFYPDGADESGYPLYRAHKSNHGYVTYENERFYWHLSDGRTLTFNGQFLVHIDWPDQRMLKLYYRQKRLASVTDETGRVLQFAYTGGSRAEALPAFEESRFGTAEGYLESVTLPDGNVIGYDYDNKRNLTRVRFPDGTSREYHYENESWPNHLTGFTDRTGVRFASWTYDEQGRANSSEHAGGVESVDLVFPDVQTVADGQVVQTQVTNSLGYTSTYTWQQENIAAMPRLLSSEGAGCATCPETGFEYTYDEQGRLLGSTQTGLGNAAGTNNVLYSYDESGRISEKRRVDAQGVEHLLERREYQDSSVLPSRVIEPSVRPDEQRIRHYEYDNAGRTISITESGWSPVVDDESRFNIDNSAINTVERWQAIERVITQEYDNQSRLVIIDGPRDDVDDVVQIEWDEKNRPVSIKSPGSPAITNTGFNALGNVTSFAIGTQSTVMIAYNAQNLPEQITQSGRTLTFSYDAEGRITAYTSPDGAVTRLEYDDAGVLVNIVKPDGSLTQYDSNNEGQSLTHSQFNRDGTMIKSVSSLFDALGRVESSRTETMSAQGNMRAETLQNTYDQNGQHVAVTNSETGAELRMQYDSLGMLASFNEPGVLPDDDSEQFADADAEPVSARQSTSVEFDAADNNIALIDARGNRTIFLKDDFGNIVVHHSADTGTTRYQYDASGNRLQKTNADGDTTSYRWDAASRMIEKQRVDGLYTYVYDEVHGKLSESVAPATTERFSYNANANLISHERTIDGREFVTRFTYDDNGRLFRKSLPDGQTLRYHYSDSSGHTRGSLETITRETLFSLRQETLVSMIDQDTGDGNGGYVASNGLRTTHSYAPDGSISSIDIDRVMKMEYEFDAAGRITGIDVNGTVQKYQYSQHGLSMAQTDGALYRYEYDDMGNRSASSVEKQDGTLFATRYDYSERGEGNQLLHETTLSGKANSTEQPLLRHDSRLYSRSGAPEQMNGFRYEYNSAQRPIKVFDNGKLLAEYAYNGFGERIKKVVYRGDQKKVTYYLYDGNTLTAEIDTASNTFKQAVFLDNAPVAYLAGQDTYAIHSDHLGTPRMATDANGDVVWSADYEPFGKATISANSSIELPYRFPGQIADAETGTHYNYFRDYDPATGRYFTSDPIGLHGGLNTYAYVANDPLGSFDPLGLARAPQPPIIPTDTPRKPTAEEKQSFTDKLGKVVDHALANLSNDAGAAAAQLLNGIKDNLVAMGAIIAVIAFNPAAAPIVLAGAWLLAGYSAAKFLLDTVKMLVNLNGTDINDTCALEGMGKKLADSLIGLASDLAVSALFGGVSKVGEALDAAAEYAGKGAWALWRALKARFGKDVTNSGACSFEGDTLVITENGYKPIKNIQSQHDRVWARDERTGKMGWRDVLAQYSNRYEETVHVTAIDDKGQRQTITSNRIHPYFARVAAGAILVTASAVTTQVAASEGHVYSGEIAGGAWVDAQHLKPGDELLSAANQWQSVESVVVEEQPLDAYNLTVDKYSTYFVAGTDEAEAVWVHNTCYVGRPKGFEDFGRDPISGQNRIKDENGRILYQGQPPNDNNWYHIDDPERLFGLSGRKFLGETRLRGLTQNRPLSELTDTDIRKTFADSPFTLSNHAISRILNPRTRALGFNTPNDIARLLNKGVIGDAGDGAISIRLDGLEAIVNPITNVIITIKPV